MKLGVLTNVCRDLPFEEACAYFASVGIELLEIGCGGTPGIDHCDPELLLADAGKLAAFRAAIEHNGLGISALSCHGNPVHPVEEIAQRYRDIFKRAVLLAEELGVHTVNTFSGCPGDRRGARYPNWVITPWPFDYAEVLRYQWEEELVPCWQELAAFAGEHGVDHIAFEMHPGFCVYNPQTLLRLREAVGPAIGANFDPSHLIWQGIDPVRAIELLQGCIYHFHAKDTRVDPYVTAAVGVLDPAPVQGADWGQQGRPFSFSIPGNGQSETLWKQMITALRNGGYDYVLSIEHEDAALGQREGVEMAARFLRSILPQEEASRCWWKAPIKEYQATFLPRRDEGRTTR